jgi:histidinol-phosphate aminotransferase
VGYAIAPAAVVTALGKTRRAFDITTPAHEAAVASLDGAREVERRRRLNAEGRKELESILRAHGLDPVSAVANFLYIDLGQDSRAFFERLLRAGVIVRPLHGFGAPKCVRVTVGTPQDHALLDEALAAVEHRAERR